MATVFDIASWSITESGAAGTVDSAEIDITAPAGAVATITVPDPAVPTVIEVEVPGIQGAKGDQNVYPQTTPPDNPEVGWVWIDIS
jgi:hypothetical protein